MPVVASGRTLGLINLSDIIRYESQSSLYLVNRISNQTSVSGLRSLDEGFIPEIFDPAVIDGKFLVSNTDAIEAVRELTEKEGIFAGVSSGGAMHVALRVADHLEVRGLQQALAFGDGTHGRHYSRKQRSNRYNSVGLRLSTVACGRPPSPLFLRPVSCR